MMAEYLESKFTETELKELDEIFKNPIVGRFEKVMNFQLEDGKEMQAKLTEISSKVYEGIAPQQAEPVERVND